MGQFQTPAWTSGRRFFAHCKVSIWRPGLGRVLWLAVTCFGMVAVADAAELKPAKAAALDRYITGTELEMPSAPPGRFLRVDTLPADQRDAEYARLRNGEVISERLQTLENGKPIPLSDGMIHHWVGMAYVKGATLQKALSFLQDYDHQAKYYSPDVQSSKLLQRQGDEFKVFLRLRKK